MDRKHRQVRNAYPIRGPFYKNLYMPKKEDCQHKKTPKYRRKGKK